MTFAAELSRSALSEMEHPRSGLRALSLAVSGSSGETEGGTDLGREFQIGSVRNAVAGLSAAAWPAGAVNCPVGNRLNPASTGGRGSSFSDTYRQAIDGYRSARSNMASFSQGFRRSRCRWQSQCIEHADDVTQPTRLESTGYGTPIRRSHRWCGPRASVFRFTSLSRV